MRIKFNEVTQMWEVTGRAFKNTDSKGITIQIWEFKTRALAREFVKQQKELNHE